MSYDFRLIFPFPGTHPPVTFDLLRQISPNSSNELRTRGLADALLGLNPNLLAQTLSPNAALVLEYQPHGQPRAAYSHFELTHKDSGVQIKLFEEEASLTVPYWHRGPKALEVFREIWGYLDLMETEVGYVTYDRQFGAVLNLRDNFDNVLRGYDRIVDRLMSAPLFEKPLEGPRHDSRN